MRAAYRDVLHRVLPTKMFDLIQFAWRDVLRLYREGFGNAYRRRRLWSTILATPPIPTDAPTAGGPAAVHLMCHRLDYLCAIWALKSFYYHAQRLYPLFLHVQGRSTPRLVRHLRTHFPNARLILQPEADQEVRAQLARRGWQKLLKARKVNPILQKLTDIV